MLKTPFDLNGKRILIANDDGIDSPGIEALERVARQFTDDVWVVAPSTEQSAMSHSLTIRRPLRLRKVDDRHFAVDGTPTDCVVMALRSILADHQPDIIFSGVNRGANMAEDVVYSGTVAAAIEGTMLGIPSIAYSQVTPRNEHSKWATAERFAGEVAKRVVSVDWPEDTLINVNFPPIDPDQVTGMEVVPLGRRDDKMKVEERPDPYGNPYYWLVDYASDDTRHADNDLSTVAAGRVAITPLRIDITHETQLKHFAAAF